MGRFVLDWRTTRIETEEPIKLLGWRRWRDRHGKWSKYHAFLLNHPRNHYDGEGDILVSDACRRGWAYLTDNGKTLPFEQPPIEKCCKNCLRELKKLGITPTP